MAREWKRRSGAIAEGEYSEIRTNQGEMAEIAGSKRNNAAATRSNTGATLNNAEQSGSKGVLLALALGSLAIDLICLRGCACASVIEPAAGARCASDRG